MTFRVFIAVITATACSTSAVGELDEIAGRLSGRWPQVSSDDQGALQQSVSMARSGEEQLAAEKLGRILAASAEAPEPWLRLSLLALDGHATSVLEEGDGRAIARHWYGVRPEHPLARAAEARWLVDEGAYAQADEVLGEPSASDDVEVLWSRLRLERALRTPEGPTAVALLALWPDHPEACEAGPREHLRSGQLRSAERTAEACMSGQSRAVAARVLADVSAYTGRPEQAREMYQAAGLMLHAAAVATAHGWELDGEERAALNESSTPALLQRAWAGMVYGESTWVRAALESLPVGGTPELQITAAAAAWWLGDAEEARARLSGLDAARAVWLREQLVTQQGTPPHDWSGADLQADPIGLGLLLAHSEPPIPNAALFVLPVRVGKALATSLPVNRAGRPADDDSNEPSASAGLPVAQRSIASRRDGGRLGLDCTVAAGEEPAGEIGKRVIAARCQPTSEACVQAIDVLAAEHPELVGLGRERYGCHDPR